VISKVKHWKKGRFFWFWKTNFNSGKKKTNHNL